MKAPRGIPSDAGDVLTVPELARYLRMDPKRLRRAAIFGSLNAAVLPIPGRVIYLSRTAVQHWLEGDTR